MELYVLENELLTFMAYKTTRFHNCNSFLLKYAVAHLYTVSCKKLLPLYGLITQY